MLYASRSKYEYSMFFATLAPNSITRRHYPHLHRSPHLTLALSGKQVQLRRRRQPLPKWTRSNRERRQCARPAGIRRIGRMRRGRLRSLRSGVWTGAGALAIASWDNWNKVNTGAEEG